MVQRFATGDAQLTLGGNPYDNIGTIYRGSFWDARLNALVARFAAAPATSTSLPAYETSGRLYQPLVTLHTLFDPVAPFWHETLYGAKARSMGSSSELVQIPSPAFGHCNVTAAQAKAALLLMLLKAGI